MSMNLRAPPGHWACGLGWAVPGWIVARPMRAGDVRRYRLNDPLNRRSRTRHGTRAFRLLLAVGRSTGNKRCARVPLGD